MCAHIFLATFFSVLSCAGAGNSMPAAEQTALVHKYCAGCHSDAAMVGGLTLQKFDAANPDPGLAAMLVSKMKSGAISASGLPMPDVATRESLMDSLFAKAEAADRWSVRPTDDGKGVTVSMVQRAPVAGAEPNLYRLIVTCRPDVHEGRMQLAWAPGDVDMPGGTVSAVVDGGDPTAYSVGHGDGAAVLAGPLPVRNLAIDKLFPNDRVVFPFDGMDAAARQKLSACFAAK